MGLIRYFFRTVEYYVLIVGLDNAGKTTLLEQMKKIFSGGPGLDPSQIPPTVGLNIGRMATDGDRLVFWDLGGQSGLRVIWEKYYSESQAVIFVVDSTDEARLEEARNALGSILRHRDLHGVPVLVLANKQDCEGALSQEEMTAALGIGPDSPAPPGRAVLCEPASALTGDGVRRGIDWLRGQLKGRARPVSHSSSV